MTEYEITPEGESTEKWAFREPGFIGSLKQLTRCARCGSIPRFKRHDEPRHFRDALKPSFHFICDDCFDELP